MKFIRKKEKQNKNNDPLIKLMAPAIAGFTVCVFCLVSMTWAWFTASVETPAQTMQSAKQYTKVKVYEIVKSEDEEKTETKRLVKPTTVAKKTVEDEEILEELKTDKEISVVTAEEPVVWELSPEKSYEVVMTGGGTATQGYCKVELSRTENGAKETKTEIYQTEAFEKDADVTFTYNTGGFENEEGVTKTQWEEYVEKTTAPTITIASYWGAPIEEEEEKLKKAVKGTNEEKGVMLLSDGAVLGLAPIPCPEARAESEMELEGFEILEGAEISAEEDYQVSLKLKEGYDMPGEVVINIGGTDFVVSTQGAEATTTAPYFDAQSGNLVVPKDLLSDGIKVSVKATATQTPVEEETTEEENAEGEEATEETENTEEQENTENTEDTENPVKKEDDEEVDKIRPNRKPSGDGEDDENDDDTDEGENDGTEGGENTEGNEENKDNTEDSENTEDKENTENTENPENKEDGEGNTENEENKENQGGSSTGGGSSTEVIEKADVKLNLTQLTINLAETKIPTNADLVLTLAAKENMTLPSEIVITLDKTIRDENNENAEITEDKTEYTISTDGKENPEGFVYDAEKCELTISSQLLAGVREITIADIAEPEVKTEISFEVKNLTFDFDGNEVPADEDVIIKFSAEEGFELPETIVITIDGKEFIVYTSEENSDKNKDGITFDIETGTVTIPKDLIKDTESITITAEGIKKEEEPEDGEDKEENKPEGGATEPTKPEVNPEAPGKDEEDDEDEPSLPTNPEAGGDDPDDDEDDNEGNNDNNGEDGKNDGTEGTNPDADDKDENENTNPSEPGDDVVTPEAPETNEPENNEPAPDVNDDNESGTENGEGTDSGDEGTDSTPDSSESTDSSTTESNDSTESSDSNESSETNESTESSDSSDSNVSSAEGTTQSSGEASESASSESSSSSESNSSDTSSTEE